MSARCQRCYGSDHQKLQGHTGPCLRKPSKRNIRAKCQSINKRAKVPRETKRNKGKDNTPMNKKARVPRETKRNKGKDNTPVEGKNTVLKVDNRTPFQNLVLGGSLYMHPSSGHNAGLGVFTRNIIREGEIITKFECKQIDQMELNELVTTKSPKFQYVYQLNRQKIFLGLDVPEENKGLGSFINCGGKSKIGINNCEICFRDHQPVVRTTKDIDAYHELFMAYGAGYNYA